MALHPNRRMVAPVASSKDDLAELREIEQRIVEVGDGLRLAAATNPATRRLIRAWEYYRADRDNASKRLRLIEAGRAVKAEQAAEAAA